MRTSPISPIMPSRPTVGTAQRVLGQVESTLQKLKLSELALELVKGRAGDAGHLATGVGQLLKSLWQKRAPAGTVAVSGFALMEKSFTVTLALFEIVNDDPGTVIVALSLTVPGPAVGVKARAPAHEAPITMPMAASSSSACRIAKRLRPVSGSRDMRA